MPELNLVCFITLVEEQPQDDPRNPPRKSPNKTPKFPSRNVSCFFCPKKTCLIKTIAHLSHNTLVICTRTNPTSCNTHTGGMPCKDKTQNIISDFCLSKLMLFNRKTEYHDLVDLFVKVDIFENGKNPFFQFHLRGRDAFILSSLHLNFIV